MHLDSLVVADFQPSPIGRDDLDLRVRPNEPLDLIEEFLCVRSRRSDDTEAEPRSLPKFVMRDF